MFFLEEDLEISLRETLIIRKYSGNVMSISKKVILAILGVIIIGFVFFNFKQSSSYPSYHGGSYYSSPTKTEVPHTVVIVSGTINIPPLQYRCYGIQVPEDAIEPRLEGSFTASGGIKNDIRVYVMNEDEFNKWKNRQKSYAMYISGEVSYGEFDIYLSPGERYYLVLDNTYSLFHGKKVSINVYLRYYKYE
jgi:hypothetical protein